MPLKENHLITEVPTRATFWSWTETQIRRKRFRLSLN